MKAGFVIIEPVSLAATLWASSFSVVAADTLDSTLMVFSPMLSFEVFLK